MILNFGDKKICFKPSIFLTLFFVSFAGVFVALGFWQLDRAEIKKQQAKTISHRLAQEILDIKPENAHQLNQPEIINRSVRIKGTFETKNQFFIDNKKHQGKAGYHVITPFKLASSEQVILINRGWVDAGNSRQVLPTIETPEEMVFLEGKMTQPAVAKFRPGVSRPTDTLNGIWLYIDTDYFNQLSGITVLPHLLLLNKESNYGFIREWPEFKANTEMHVGYAIQWFAFALFSILAYFTIGLKKYDTNS